MSGEKIKNKSAFQLSNQVIHHADSKDRSRAILSIYFKKKNNKRWVMITPPSELHAIFYAVNAGVAHLLIPYNTGKVRLVRHQDQFLLFTKFREDYISLANSSYWEGSLRKEKPSNSPEALARLQKKILSPITVRSAAAVMVDWYVRQEADANLGNVGLTEHKNKFYRLDYDYSLIDFTAPQLGIKKDQIFSRYQNKVSEHSQPDPAWFPITKSDLNNFPDCSDISPVNYMGLSRDNGVDLEFLQSLNKNPDFMKYVDFYFLKSMLIEPGDIENIFDMHIDQNKSTLRRSYIHYLDQRQHELKSKLFNLKRFRENLKENFSEYKRLILEEFIFYNKEFKENIKYKIDIEKISLKLDFLFEKYLPLYEHLATLEEKNINPYRQEIQEFLEFCRILLDMDRGYLNGNLSTLEQISIALNELHSFSDKDNVPTLTGSLKKSIYENLKNILKNQRALLDSSNITPYKLAISDLIKEILVLTEDMDDINVAIQLLTQTQQYCDDLQNSNNKEKTINDISLQVSDGYKQDAVGQVIACIKERDYKSQALFAQKSRLRLETDNRYTQELTDFVEKILDYLNAQSSSTLDQAARSYILESTNQLCTDILSGVKNNTITPESFESTIHLFFQSNPHLLSQLFIFSSREAQTLIASLSEKNYDKLSVFSAQMSSACLYAEELWGKNELLIALSFQIKINAILKITDQHKLNSSFEDLSNKISDEVKNPNIILSKHRGVKGYLEKFLHFLRRLFFPSLPISPVNTWFNIQTERINRLAGAVQLMRTSEDENKKKIDELQI